MTYEEFKQELKERVQQRLGSKTEVYFCTVEKNNQKRKEGLTFREEGINTMPMIHMQDLYEEYFQNSDMEKMVDYVLEILKTKTVMDEKVILGKWETVRNRIHVKLINYEWNREMLEHTPHHRVLDLAVIFQIVLYQNGMRRATVTIKNEFLNIWGITLNTMFETAMENLQKESYEIRNMRDVLGEMLKVDMDEDVAEGTDEDDMYVLSNEARCNGAVGLLRKDLLKEFAEKIQRNFYILPSSTNELIFLPETNGMEIGNLKKMVKEINDTQVEVEERLADNVYYFDRETGMVRM